MKCFAVLQNSFDFHCLFRSFNGHSRILQIWKSVQLSKRKTRRFHCIQGKKTTGFSQPQGRELATTSWIFFCIGTYIGTLFSHQMGLASTRLSASTQIVVLEQTGLGCGGRHRRLKMSIGERKGLTCGNTASNGSLIKALQKLLPKIIFLDWSIIIIIIMCKHKST